MATSITFLLIYGYNILFHVCPHIIITFSSCLYEYVCTCMCEYTHMCLIILLFMFKAYLDSLYMLWGIDSTFLFFVF